MEIQFVIVRSENAEYLCHNVNGTYVDVSGPINRICFWRG